MSYVIGGMAIAGGTMALMGRDSNQSITTNANTSNQGQSTWSPHPQVLPAYGGLLDNMNQMGQTPTPFFPGPTYAGPSAPTMQGINMGMSSMPDYYQGAQGLRAAGGQYGQAGAMAPGVANSYNAAGAMAPGVANQFGQAGGAYGQAAAMAPGVANQFGQAGGAYGNASNMYGNAAGGLLGARGAYGDAGQAFGAAVPGQLGALGTALGNYDFLSRSADVANNPYVQGQADAMKRTVNQNFKEDLLPAINQGANQVNALGSSRHGLAQAQGAERTAEQLSRGLADLYGGAYGQGLSAQQSALGQLGNMQAGFARPGETLARRAQMGDRSAQLGLEAANAGERGALMMQNRANMGRQGMNVMGEGAGFMQNRANMGLQGMNAMGRGAGYNQQAMNAMGQGAGYTQRGGEAFGGAGDMLNRGASNALGYGQAVEGYQQQAQDDAIRRQQYQYQEPWQRMMALGNMMGMFQPMGTGNTSGVGNGMGVQPNPNFQSPMQAFAGGAFAGAGLGSRF